MSKITLARCLPNQYDSVISHSDVEANNGNLNTLNYLSI